MDRFFWINFGQVWNFRPGRDVSSARVDWRDCFSTSVFGWSTMDPGDAVDPVDVGDVLDRRDGCIIPWNGSNCGYRVYRVC